MCYAALMSIGVVMFFKALIVGLWCWFEERWSERRKRRAQDGLPMRYSRFRKAYVVSDWMALAERSAVFARNAVYTLLACWWLFIGYFMLTGQREQLGLIFDRLFFQ